MDKKQQTLLELGHNEWFNYRFSNALKLLAANGLSNKLDLYLNIFEKKSNNTIFLSIQYLFAFFEVLELPLEDVLNGFMIFSLFHYQFTACTSKEIKNQRKSKKYSLNDFFNDLNFHGKEEILQYLKKHLKIPKTHDYNVSEIKQSKENDEKVRKIEIKFVILITLRRKLF